MKIAKRISLILVAGIALMALLLVGLRLYFSDTWIGEKIVSTLAEQTGAKVELTSFSASGLLTAKLDGLRLSLADGSTLFFAEQVTADLAFGDLIRQTLTVREVSLRRPELLIVRKNGVFNFEEILRYRAEKFPTVPEPEAPGKSIFETLDSPLPKLPLSVNADLEKIGFENFAVIFRDEAKPELKLDGLTLWTSVRAKLADKISVIAVVVDVLHDAMTTQLKLVLDVDMDRPSNSRVSIEPTLKVNLAKAMALVAPHGVIPPDSDASGMVSVQDSKIVGMLDLAALKEQRFFPDLKRSDVSLSVVVKDVAAKLGKALALGPLQVDLQTTVREQRFALQLKTHLTSAMAMQKRDRVDISDLRIATDVVASVSELELEKFTTDISLAKVTAKSSKLGTLTTPVSAQLSASTADKLTSGRTSLKASLGDLASLAVDGACSDKCKNLAWNVATSIPRLSEVFRIARPIAVQLGLENVLPDEVAGALRATIKARGGVDLALKDDTRALISQVMSHPQLGIEAQVALSDFSLSTKRPQEASVKGLSVDFKTDVTPLVAKISLDQKLAALNARIVPPGKKPITAELDRQSLALSLTTELKRIVDPEKLKTLTPEMVDALIADLKAGLSASLKIAQLKSNAVESLPPLDNIGFETGLTLNRGGLAKLDRLIVSVPTFGIDASGSAEVVLASLKDKIPIRSMKSRFFAGVDSEKVSNSGLASGVKMQGASRFNIELASEDMNNFNVAGLLDFANFNLVVPSKVEGKNLLVVEALNGQVPFTQSVDAQSVVKRAALAEPSETEGVERDAIADYYDKHQEGESDRFVVAPNVDYASVRGFYPKRQPLTIAKLEAANLSLTEIEIDTEVRQNVFAVNHMLIGFLRGCIQGGVQVSFDPLPSKIKLAVHVTKLNTHDLLESFPGLRKKAVGWGASNPFIDATVHLAFDAVTNDLSGGIDVTSIGKEQLKMILFYVDPTSVDPTINLIRKALIVGDVRNVSIPIKNGMIGMDVDVRLLVGAPIPLPKLQRFPISQLLQNFRSGSAQPQAAKTASH